MLRDKKISYYDIFFALMLVDIHIFSVNILYIFMIFYILLVAKKIFISPKLIILLCVMFAYALVSLTLNKFDYPLYKTYVTGPIRPLFVFLTFVLEVFFVCCMLRRGSRTLNFYFQSLLICGLFTAYLTGILKKLLQE